MTKVKAAKEPSGEGVAKQEGFRRGSRFGAGPCRWQGIGGFGQFRAYKSFSHEWLNHTLMPALRLGFEGREIVDDYVSALRANEACLFQRAQIARYELRHGSDL
jgi:hypothetical protein